MKNNFLDKDDILNADLVFDSANEQKLSKTTVGRFVFNFCLWALLAVRNALLLILSFLCWIYGPTALISLANSFYGKAWLFAIGLTLIILGGYLVFGSKRAHVVK